jgi:hypothetical protein
MVMIEMKDSLYDTAFDLLDEAKLNAKKTKLTLCELENAMYDCYESIKEEENGEDEKDMKFRGVSGYKEDYRHDEQYGVGDDEEEAMLNRRMSHRRRNMRMRRRLV